MNIADLSSLGNLTGLTHLHLKNCFDQATTDVSPISGLSGLDYLALEALKLNDIVFISGLTGLDTLSLIGNDLETDDLTQLYGLTNLKPHLDLYFNGEGFPDDAIAVLASKLPNIKRLQSDTRFYTYSDIWWQSSDKYVEINSDLRIKVESIDTPQVDVYDLSGYMSIQKEITDSRWDTYMRISNGTARLDKRSTLANPEFSGSGTLTAFGNEILTGSFHFTVGYSTLVPDEPYPVSGDLYGFPLQGGELYLQTSGTEAHYVRQKIQLQDMPFPVNKIFDYVEESTEDLSSISGTKEFYYNSYYGSNNISYAYNLSLGGFNFGAFAIRSLTLSYNSSTQSMGGKITMKIPGYASGDLISKSGISAEKEIPVEFTNESGEVIGSANLGDLKEMAKAWPMEFLEFDMDMQFVEGDLDKLVIAVTTDIPLGATGLFITQMTGGLEDLSTDNFKILANVDIETGLSVPVLGSPVKINDFGVKIAPYTQFEGSGELEVFGSKTANTKLSYDAQKMMLEMSGNVNIGDVLIGKMDASLKQGSFTGKIYGNMQTPAKLPWGFGWAANRKLSAVEAQIDGKIIQAQGQIWKLTLAQRMEFGKESFPYFHYSIGRNYQSLYNIWKGDKSSNFSIPNNVGQAMIVVGNDANLFDFSLISPSGVEYNSSNTDYQQFDESLQTIMLLDHPESGNWQLNTSQTGDIIIDVKVLNPAPAVEFTYPVEKNTLSDSIVFSYFDIQDTVEIEVYIDNDQSGFDGNYYLTYGLYQNLTEGIARMTWNRKVSGSGWREVPNGEYFVYVKVDDGNNAPLYQYAPGSILVRNFEFDSIPQNLKATQIYDSILVQWDELVDTSFMTTIHCINLSEDEEIVVSTKDSNFIYLNNLQYGQEYEIYAAYNDPYMLYEGFKSNRDTVLFADSVNNNPPYFGPNKEEWVFIESENRQYDIEANDIDGDDMTFEVVSGPSGMSAANGFLTWDPLPEDQGIVEIILKVSDGTDNDTLIKNVEAYSQDQIAIQVGFNSPLIYDDSYNLIKIYNFWSDSATESLTIKNLRSSEEADITCFRTVNNTFISRFDISSEGETILTVEDGDTLEAIYMYDETPYKALAVYNPTNNTNTGSDNVVNGDQYFKIYPNPASSFVNIEFKKTINTSEIVKVFNMAGQMVYLGYADKNKIRLDIGDASPGLYFVSLTIDGREAVSKLLIE